MWRHTEWAGGGGGECTHPNPADSISLAVDSLPLPGRAGLRKKTRVFMQDDNMYLKVFVQAMFTALTDLGDSLGLEGTSRDGCSKGCLKSFAIKLSCLRGLV